MRKAFDKANGPLGITALSAAKKTLNHYRQKVRAGDDNEEPGAMERFRCGVREDIT